MTRASLTQLLWSIGAIGALTSASAYAQPTAEALGEPSIAEHRFDESSSVHDLAYSGADAGDYAPDLQETIGWAYVGAALTSVLLIPVGFAVGAIVGGASFSPHCDAGCTLLFGGLGAAVALPVGLAFGGAIGAWIHGDNVGAGGSGPLALISQLVVPLLGGLVALSVDDGFNDDIGNFTIGALMAVSFAPIVAAQAYWGTQP